MADENWKNLSDIEKNLLNEPRSFSFFQAIRLLRLILRKKEEEGIKNAASFEGPCLRIRPDLTLAFPSADIDRIDKVMSPANIERFLITATFLGLYGSSSPLPTFYTEDLLHDALEDRTVTRDFIDIINYILYPLFIRSWLKYNVFLNSIEEKNEDFIERIFCLIGLGDDVERSLIKEPFGLMRYAGLLTQYPRSAVGLQTILRDTLQTGDLEVIPCIEREVKIPLEQLNILGEKNSALGETLYLGDSIIDRMGKFRIRISNLSFDKYEELLPGTPIFERLRFLTEFYIIEKYEYDIELVPAVGEIKTIRLGVAGYNRLGMDAWLRIFDRQPEPVIIQPEEAIDKLSSITSQMQSISEGVTQ